MAIQVQGTTVIDDNKFLTVSGAEVSGSTRTVVIDKGSVDVAGTTMVIDPSAGNYFNLQVNAACTINVQTTNVSSGKVHTSVLSLRVNTTSTITWGSNIYWPNNQQPLLTPGKSILIGFITEGSYVRASYSNSYTTIV